MVDDLIPDDVKAFLLKHIDSVAQLEALLLLRANPDLEWNAETLAKRLYVSVQETAGLLARLCADGFLEARGDQTLIYQYHCRVSEQVNIVDRVAELYGHYLIPITHFIHAKPRTRVQEFADAFRLRKDE